MFESCLTDLFSWFTTFERHYDYVVLTRLVPGPIKEKRSRIFASDAEHCQLVWLHPNQRRGYYLWRYFPARVGKSVYRAESAAKPPLLNRHCSITADNRWTAVEPLLFKRCCSTTPKTAEKGVRQVALLRECHRIALLTLQGFASFRAFCWFARVKVWMFWQQVPCRRIHGWTNVPSCSVMDQWPYVAMLLYRSKLCLVIQEFTRIVVAVSRLLACCCRQQSIRNKHWFEQSFNQWISLHIDHSIIQYSHLMGNWPSNHPTIQQPNPHINNRFNVNQQLSQPIT